MCYQNTHVFTSAGLPASRACVICVPVQKTRIFKNIRSGVQWMSRRFTINTAGRCMRRREATQLMVK